MRTRTTTMYLAAMTSLLLVTLAGACERKPSTGISKETTSSSGTGASAPAPCAPPANCVCPSGLTGPDLVLLPGPNSSVYCMDARETTRAEYDAFLAAKGTDTTGQPDACAWNDAYTPVLWPNDPSDDVSPPVYCRPESWNQVLPGQAVGCVDFCDALAYCEWAGKRLCGRVGGPSQWGRVHVAYTNPTEHDQMMSTIALSPQTEYYNACTQGGASKYPYGDSYQPVCIDDNWVAANNSKDVSNPAARSCHGTTSPFNTISDLSGSAREWQNFCGRTGGPADPGNLSCAAVGGSYIDSDETLLSCAGGYGESYIRSVAPEIGFRCCADAVTAP